jgi:hypothetical protein
LIYLGGQNKFSRPLKQTILGVKEHGVGVTIYRTCGTATKSCNLSCYVICNQIERWKERNCYYPEELYLQVDGGSENANNLMLGFLELLVSKRILQTIYFTRLPTGHTHEDIDAVFGVIWKATRLSSCETLDKFVEMVQRAFNYNPNKEYDESRKQLTITVTDVYVVPSYEKFISPSIDKDLSNLHKLQNTQHQWRFQAVDKTTSFPFGCKTEYRAYASDKVVEFISKPKEHCHSKIGKLLGLEPTTVYCQWYPTPSCFRRRYVVSIHYCLELINGVVML